jgi:hypothetical protein
MHDGSPSAPDVVQPVGTKKRQQGAAARKPKKAKKVKKAVRMAGRSGVGGANALVRRLDP